MTSENETRCAADVLLFDEEGPPRVSRGIPGALLRYGFRLDDWAARSVGLIGHLTLSVLGGEARPTQLAVGRRQMVRTQSTHQ